MPDQPKHTTKIIVTEQKQIHKGRNRNGGEYTIWQVIAQKPSGEPIPEGMNLRSFDELPKNQVIEVEVEKYTSAQYGTSYTVTQKGKRRGSGLAKRVDELFNGMKRLHARVEVIERHLNLGADQPAVAAQGPPAAPSPAQPPAQPPPAPASDGMPNDDIPF